MTEITAETLEHLLVRLKEKKRAGELAPIVAVGTTSLRTLESVYWMGLKVLRNPAIAANDLKISQWQPYEEVANITAEEAVAALFNWLKTNGLQKITCKTQIMIAPGYKPRIVEGLITNFHQPNSTLLLLIAALLGDDWKRIYDYALSHDFRFLSLRRWIAVNVLINPAT